MPCFCFCAATEVKLKLLLLPQFEGTVEGTSRSGNEKVVHTLFIEARSGMSRISGLCRKQRKQRKQAARTRLCSCTYGPWANTCRSQSWRTYQEIPFTQAWTSSPLDWNVQSADEIQNHLERLGYASFLGNIEFFSISPQHWTYSPAHYWPAPRPVAAAPEALPSFPEDWRARAIRQLELRSDRTNSCAAAKNRKRDGAQRQR